MKELGIRNKNKKKTTNVIRITLNNDQSTHKGNPTGLLNKEQKNANIYMRIVQMTSLVITLYMNLERKSIVRT